MIELALSRFKWYPEPRILHGKLSELPEVNVKFGGRNLIQVAQNIEIFSDTTGSRVVFQYNQTGKSLNSSINSTNTFSKFIVNSFELKGPYPRVDDIQLYIEKDIY